MSLLCKTHTMLPMQMLHNGAGRGAGPTVPWDGPQFIWFLFAFFWVTGGLSIILGCWHISKPQRGLIVQGLLFSVRGLSLCCKPRWQMYCRSRQLFLFFVFVFFLGYRGIVHPPSDDGGTERTWFVPEHRPRKHFLSDQFKASKMSTLCPLVLTKIPDKCQMCETPALSR